MADGNVSLSDSERSGGTLPVGEYLSAIESKTQSDGVLLHVVTGMFFHFVVLTRTLHYLYVERSG